jgi:hypothetical protein
MKRLLVLFAVPRAPIAPNAPLIELGRSFNDPGRL